MNMDHLYPFLGDWPIQIVIFHSYVRITRGSTVQPAIARPTSVAGMASSGGTWRVGYRRTWRYWPTRIGKNWFQSMTGWWFEPLWKIWLRQLGWHSQMNGKIKFMFQSPPTRWAWICLKAETTCRYLCRCSVWWLSEGMIYCYDGYRI